MVLRIITLPLVTGPTFCTILYGVVPLLPFWTFLPSCKISNLRVINTHSGFESHPLRQPVLFFLFVLVFAETLPIFARRIRGVVRLRRRRLRVCNSAHTGCTGRIPERLQFSTYGSISESRLLFTCAFNFWIQVNAQGVCAGAAVLGHEGMMLYYALVFLLVALVAGFLGFGGIAFAAAGVAKIFFFIFLVVFVVTLIMHLLRGDTAGN